MQYFFHLNLNFPLIILNKEETKHLSILRKQPGDEIILTDGKGTLADAKILSFSKNGAEISIEKKREVLPNKNKIHIAIAPTKNAERIEWFVEKCCEIGISEITFLQCNHSERKKVNMERLEKIIISACKQSQKAYFPVLNPIVNFNSFVLNTNTIQKFIAYCGFENLPHLKSLLKPLSECLVLIGPEGDFTKEEIEISIKNNFVPVNLGNERLRTETAGIYACTLYNIIT